MAKKNKKLRVFEFTIILVGTAPVVWRKILAHDFIELNELHTLIQMSMGWSDTHLFSFEINGKSYSDPETALESSNIMNAEGLELNAVLGDSKIFTYTYDFGDDWIHQIEVTQVLEHDSRVKYPVCIAGENACPPEDCGGPHGFERLKSILEGQGGPEKDEMITWVGGYYNPYTFDPNFVNKILFWNEDDF